MRFPTRRGLVLRTRVYRVLHRLVRWPMIIPFVAAIAAPIVEFQGIDDIVAGPGATPLFMVIALIDAGRAAVRAEDDVDARQERRDERARSPQRDGASEEAPQAKVHLAKWSPWIWIIPALAIFFAGWLVVRYGFFGGGDITVRFADARGLDRYSPVRFRGAKVGTVQKITIDKNLRQVVVRISMDASMNHALNKGHAFLDRRAGPRRRRPRRAALRHVRRNRAGRRRSKSASSSGRSTRRCLRRPRKGRRSSSKRTASARSPSARRCNIHGMRVGSILGAEYDAAARHDVRARVHRASDSPNDVRQSTRFWRGGGLNVSLGGGGVSIGRRVDLVAAQCAGRVLHARGPGRRAGRGRERISISTTREGGGRGARRTGRSSRTSRTSAGRCRDSWPERRCR